MRDGLAPYGGGALPSYAADADCAKCGHYAVSTRHCPGTVVLAPPLWVPKLLAYLWPRKKGPCRFAAREHLHRQCERCGYLYAEACVDDVQHGWP